MALQKTASLRWFQGGNFIASLQQHGRKLLLLCLLWALQLLANISTGQLKPLATIDWLDVIGESASALAFLIWLVLILASRPVGRVTDLLSIGLGFMFLAMFQDALDEWLQLADSVRWQNWLESLVMPLGIGLLTFGLWHWYREQLLINQQLSRREGMLREYRQIDGLTQLGRVDYLTQHLQLLRQQPLVQSVSVLMVDVENFSHFNRQYGHREGDRLLIELSELLLLNMRFSDTLCRFGADRFVIVMPN